jgi:hypothetical protein
MFPGRDVEQSYYDLERRESAKLPHRRQDLERLALMLQSTPLREQVWQVIDDYKAKLPPQSDQDEADRMWRLVLHRIDIRNFAVSGTTKEGLTIIQASEPAADVQAVVERHRPRSEAQVRRMNLLAWGIAVFRRDTNSAADASLWPAKLAEAQECVAAETESQDALDLKLEGSGPDYIASICIRDHWDELNEDQQTWCANRICAAVVADAETTEHLKIVGRNPLDGSRPAAFVLAALFGKELQSISRGRLTEILGIALTHPIEEIVQYAIQGVGTFLWDADRDLALTCVGALAQQAREHGTFVREQYALDFFNRQPQERFLDRLRETTRLRIRNRTIFPDQTLLGLNLGEWPAQVTLPLLLALLTQRPDEPLARSFFTLLTAQIVAAWTTHAEERRRNRPRPGDNDEFLDPDRISGLNESLASFALRLRAEAAIALLGPILGAMSRHPERVAEFADWLIRVEATNPSGEVFWAIWQAAADRFRASDLPASVDMEHSGAAKLLRTLFLNTNWKDTARDWAPLHGNEHRIHELFNTLPASSEVLRAYACFLYKIGAATLPLPLIAIAEKLGSQADRSLLSQTTVFYLDTILGRLIQDGSASTLVHDNVRHAVLFLLDELVEQGSSTAYKLRDDFVTPPS